MSERESAEVKAQRRLTRRRVQEALFHMEERSPSLHPCPECQRETCLFGATFRSIDVGHLFLVGRTRGDTATIKIVQLTHSIPKRYRVQDITLSRDQRIAARLRADDELREEENRARVRAGGEWIGVSSHERMRAATKVT